MCALQPPFNRLLLIGWDAAEWNVIRPLVQQGQLPHLARLIGRGQTGNLRIGHPMLSPTAWTTIVTGQHPTRHGVFGGAEAVPLGSTVQPIGRSACAASPVWSLLDKAGIPCHSVNFPATHPAEPLAGVSISNQFATDRDISDAVLPRQVRDGLRALRTGPSQIDVSTLRSFAPRAEELNALDDPGVRHIAGILAHTASVHAAATWAIQNVPWQFAAVCYTGLHQFSHGFMQFHPPKMAAVDERQFALFQDAVAVAYRFHDMMLGRLIQLAGPDINVLLCSDHGFATGSNRPDTRGLATEQAMLAWHRDPAMFVAAGPDVAPRADIRHLDALDIAPTILGLFGLKPTEHMRAISLFGAAGKKPVPLASITTAEPARQKSATDPAVDYLRHLGYAPPSDPQAQFVAQHRMRRRQYHLAIAWLDARRPKRAVAILEALIAENPTDVKIRTALAHAYGAAGQTADCRKMVDEFLRDFPDSAAAAAALGTLELAARRAQSAIACFQKADDLGMRSPGLLSDVGRAYLRLRKFGDARRAFERAIDLDPDCAVAHDGLGRALLGEGDAIRAAETCARAVALSPREAAFVYRLGLALLRLERWEEARQTLMSAVRIDPEFPPALRKLAEVCDRMGYITEAQAFARQAVLAATSRRLQSAATGTAPQAPR